MNFSDFLDCPFDLLEVLIQFDELKSYSEFLEAHLNWPKNIELQKVRKITDNQEYFQAVDSIEHKYSNVLPIRFSYSYVTQYCSCLEWSLRKILLLKNYPDLQKVDIDKMGIHKLILQISSRLNIKIKNKQEINKVIKARNRIVHSNGRIEDLELNDWCDSTLYSVQKIFDENILVINKGEFFRVYSESSLWLVECCKT